MRVILFFATLAPLFLAGNAANLKSLFFCDHRCPKPEETLRHCLFRCGWKFGSYWDGSPCWILGRLGNRLNLKGYCKRGICVRSRSGYSGSKAELHCSPKTTTTLTVATAETTAKAIPGTTPHSAESDQRTSKPNSSLPVTQPSGRTNATTSKNESSPTKSSSITQVLNLKNTSEEKTTANGLTQAPSNRNSSPTAPYESVTNATRSIMDVGTGTPAPSSAIPSSTTSVENVTTTPEGPANADVTSPVFSPNGTSSGTVAQSDSPAKDTHMGNASIQDISTASTLSTTGVQSEPTPLEETSEGSKPGTRTYGPRPDWLNERFPTATTAKITSKANASSDVIASSTTEATSADSNHTVSTRGTDTAGTIEKQESTVTAIKETVGANSSDNAMKTTAASTTSNMAC